MTSAATQHANWTQAWRDQVLPELAQQTWDLIVIGGGITGAGVIREAAKRGWRCLLVEQRDFAWGTSSRSSKMVHGGLRYISQGELALTRDSVRERQLLLDNEAGLVEPLPFLYPHYQGEFPGRWVFSLGIASLRWFCRAIFATVSSTVASADGGEWLAARAFARSQSVSRCGD